MSDSVRQNRVAVTCKCRFSTHYVSCGCRHPCWVGVPEIWVAIHNVAHGSQPCRPSYLQAPCRPSSWQAPTATARLPRVIVVGPPLSSISSKQSKALRLKLGRVYDAWFHRFYQRCLALMVISPVRLEPLLEWLSPALDSACPTPIPDPAPPEVARPQRMRPSMLSA